VRVFKNAGSIHTLKLELLRSSRRGS